MMRIGVFALIAFLGFGTAALAEDPAGDEDVDSWVGCWTRVYDAVHLSKHPAQKLTALTLSVAPREDGSEESPGAYSAKITALVRDKPDSFANPESARCVEQGGTLSCFTDGFFIGKFTIERAGKNRKLALRGAGQNLALVPGVDLGSFIVMSSQDAENALFLLQAAPEKSCTR
jgi:putative hemolysin